MGGVVGNFTASMSPPGSNIKNTVFKDGIISVQGTGNTTATVHVGGFAGSIGTYTSFINCNSRARSVTAWSTDNNGFNINIGGFAGSISGTTVSDCYSSSTVIVPPEHIATRFVSAGGFCGRLISGITTESTSKMEKCYATGNVSIHGRSTKLTNIEKFDGGVGAGGLVGTLCGDPNARYWDSCNPSIISQCYATGSVTAVNHASLDSGINFGVGGLAGIAFVAQISESYATGSVNARKGTGGNAPVVAGGLVGYLLHNTNVDNAFQSYIENCYASGDVSADNPNSDTAPVYAGGLAGYVNVKEITKGGVTSSFASGTVSAKNASSGAGAWAGGIVGYKLLGKLEQCVASGRPGRVVSVSAQGGNSRYAGRIYGGSVGATPAKNFANEAIYAGTSTGYYTAPSLAVVTSGTGPGTVHGANASNASLSGQTFWTTDTVNVSPGGFSTDYWNFSPVAQGWPALKNVGGQQ